MKYYVRLVRPVFQEALVAVEAGSDAEAAERALDSAEALEDQEWKGGFDPDAYSYHVAQLASEEELEGEGPEVSALLDASDKYYVLLEANADAGEGAVLPQPWMKGMTDLMAVDLASDWIGEIDNLKTDGLLGFKKELEQIEKEEGLPPGVASFAKYLWRKRMKWAGEEEG